MAKKEQMLNALHQISKDLDIQNVTQAVVPVLSSVIQNKNEDKISTIVSQICHIRMGVKYILDNDNIIKLKGIMTIGSAARELFPFVQSGVKELADFIATLLRRSVGYHSGKESNEHSDMIEVMKINSDVNTTSIDNFLKSEVDSVYRFLAFAHNILIGFQSKSDGEITQNEVTNLVSLVDLSAGIKAIGKIESGILRLIETIPKKGTESEMSEGCSGVNQYLDRYCRLAILRDAIMLELYTVITYSGHACHLANGILKGMEGEQERDRNLIQCLVFPEQNQVHFASFFDPGQWPLTYQFLQNRRTRGLIDNVEHKPIGMNTIKWMNWFASHGDRTSTYLRSEGCNFKEHVHNKHHNFIFQKKENDICYYISPQGHPDIYMVMSESKDKWVKLKSGIPGRDGEWNIFNIRNMDAVYMLSTRRWPAHFFCMSDTWRGWLQGRSTVVSDPKVQWVLHFNGSEE